MNQPEREAAVRRMLEQNPPQVPPDLYPAVVRRGARMLRLPAFGRDGGQRDAPLPGPARRGRCGGGR
ncbi:hypothetical protein ABZS63_28005, partial [Streptomyces sp. NPDC005568]